MALSTTNTRQLFRILDFSRRHTSRDFFDFDIDAWETLLATKGEGFWEEAGKKNALRLFHAVATRVPAYARFLKRHRVAHERIKNFDDLVSYAPPTDKKNYIAAYPLEERCWDGALGNAHLIAMSSGTTGEPTFWPRSAFQELEAGVLHELIYKHLFDMDRYETLLLIGFPMGVYVSGVATLLPSMLFREKGYPCTIMSVSNQKGEMLRAVTHLRKKFRQIVLVGHPFFIKDVLETGRTQGIDWSRRRLKIMFCSEGFNEAWRRYVIDQAGIAPEDSPIISTYGSSEMLLMAHETPLSILVRRMAEDNAMAGRLFKGCITSGLFQYNPFSRYIETVGEELLFTAASGIPLVRFNLHDTGRIISFADMKKALDESRPEWRKEISSDGAGKKNVWQIPFLALGNRSDRTVIFYAANIYPEHIRVALQHRSFLNKLTGKFVIRKDYLPNRDEFLELHIELREKIRGGDDLIKAIGDRAVKTLREINTEYADASARLDKDMRPRIVLWPYQDEKYFRPGLKPKYIVE